MLFLVFGGVAFVAMGLGTRWMTRRFLGGRVAGLSYSLIILGVMMPLGALLMRNDYATVMPDAVEIYTDGDKVSFKIDDIVDQKTYSKPGRRGSINWYSRFDLRGGQSYSFSSTSVAGDAYDHIIKVRNDRRVKAALAPEPAPAIAAEENAAAPAPLAPSQSVAMAAPAQARPNTISPPPAIPAQPTVASLPVPTPAQGDTLPSAAAPSDAARHSPASRATMPPRQERPLPLREPPEGARQVTAETPLAVGMRILANWAEQYYPSEILALADNGETKIHYLGYADGFDAVVPRGDLYVEISERAKESSASNSAAGSLAAEKAGGMRTWKDNTGKHKVEAKLEGVADGNATLVRADGKRVSLPLARLSKDDREYLKSIGRWDE